MGTLIFQKNQEGIATCAKADSYTTNLKNTLQDESDPVEDIT